MVGITVLTNVEKPQIINLQQLKGGGCLFHLYQTASERYGPRCVALKLLSNDLLSYVSQQFLL